MSTSPSSAPAPPPARAWLRTSRPSPMPDTVVAQTIWHQWRVVDSAATAGMELAASWANAVSSTGHAARSPGAASAQTRHATRAVGGSPASHMGQRNATSALRSPSAPMQRPCACMPQPLHLRMPATSGPWHTAHRAIHALGVRLWVWRQMAQWAQRSCEPAAARKRKPPQRPGRRIRARLTPCEPSSFALRVRFIDQMLALAPPAAGGAGCADVAAPGMRACA